MKTLDLVEYKHLKMLSSFKHINKMLFVPLNLFEDFLLFSLQVPGFRQEIVHSEYVCPRGL